MGNANVLPAEDRLGKLIANMSVEEKVSRLFELVDFDGDGTVDWAEVGNDSCIDLCACT